MKYKSMLFLLCVSVQPLSYAVDIKQELYQTGISDSENSVTFKKETNYQLALVKNQEALGKVLLQKSPLDYLSAESKRRFVNNLKFGENGLSSFYYSDLEAELTATQIYNILSLFGAQHLTYLMKDARVESPLDATLLLDRYIVTDSDGGAGDDHSGYKCESPGTCVISSGRICTSNC